MMRYIERRAAGRIVPVLLAAAMIVYAFMMTVTIPTVTREAHGLPVFDLRPGGYSLADARTLLGTMTDQGKWYYAHVQIPTDFLYPPLLGFFGVFALAWLRRRVRFPKLLILLPLGATLFDWLENVAILFMLSGNLDPRVVAAASAFTVSKSVFTSIFMTALLVIGIVALIKAVIGGRRHADESA